MSRKTIRLAQYNPNWPGFASDMVWRLKIFLNHNFIICHHIGSTAITGMSAKPEIDLILVVDDLSDISKLECLGYEYRGEFNIPLRRCDDFSPATILLK